MLKVRRSEKKDIQKIFELYQGAQDFMAHTGNPNQWGKTYPTLDMVREDIENGASFVIADENGIHGVFMLLLEEDPCYKVIENGEWKNSKPYVTIHRIASDFKVKGVLKCAVDFALSFKDNVRIDTHRDNKVMQSALKKLGFEECGIIYVRDHSPRIAFQLVNHKICTLSAKNDKIKVVFFDIDNTLISFEEYVKWAMRSGFEKYGFKKYEDYMFDVFHKINTGFWKRLEDGKITLDELQRTRWGVVLNALGVESDGIEFEDYFRRQIFDSAILEDGAMDIVEYLDGKYILASASNGPHDQQVHRMEICGLAPHFDYNFISEKVGVAKPSPIFFERALEIMREDGVDVKPEECIMIGDSISSDMVGGRNAGMHTCYFTRGQHLDVKPDSADYVVATLDEIKNIL